MKRILFVVGTRPEIVKTAPVIQRFRNSGRYRVEVCLSGQHKSMVSQMLRDFDLELDHDLKIMKRDQTLVSISKRLMPRLEEVYSDFDPHIVFVQGDTTTAFIAALVAFYHKIPVAHIEAGLRTGDKHFPFPEEMNRSLIGNIAERHYAPTSKAKDNLRREGVPAGKIKVTGNTGIDSLKYMLSKDLDYANVRLRQIPQDKKVVLITAHRRENFGNRLGNMIKGIKHLAGEYRETLFIYPVHPNPNVKEPVFRELGDTSNVELLPSLFYRDLIKLMDRCRFILTDSGGIQEEAPYLGTPVLVLRDKTERPEAIKSGAARIVGADTDKMIDLSRKLMENTSVYEKMAVKRNIFGDGRAAERILADIDKLRG